MHWSVFTQRWLVVALAGAGAVAWTAGAFGEALPENLAVKAAITASSEFDAGYRAARVADGLVPVVDSGEDRDQAWAVDGATHRDGAELSFEWPEPVAVVELVYYGRTAWGTQECWRDYAVHVDDRPEPVLRGQLGLMHGPQRIVLPAPVELRKLRLVFASSYGGPNPGASEIQVFGESPSDTALAAFLSPLRHMPWVDRVDPKALRGLIECLAAEEHVAGEHASAWLARLGAPGEDSAALQREVLLSGIDRVVAIRRHEIVASHVYTYHYEGFRPGGGLCVVDLRSPDGEATELVASPTGQILDCDLSHDGRTILFSWRQTEDTGYHLWTIGVDGAGLTQVTDGPWHDYNGCWLPDGGIAFLSTREAQFAYCWHAPVGIVHRMDADGANVRKLSANYLNDFTPYVLHDGRILFTRWEYVDRPAIPIQSLWTMGPDGAGLAGYFGNRVLSPGTFMEARPIPGSTKIICTMTGHNGPTRGAIGIVDRERGMNAQEAIENITPDVPVPGVNEGNGNTDGTKPYSCPVPLDGERFLLSAQGPVLVRTYSGDCQSLALSSPGHGMQWFSAQPVRERSRPPVVSSAPTEDEDAVIYLQDVYRGLEPAVRRGEVRRIRVVREMQKTVRIDPELRAFGFQFPVISCGATYAGKDVLGEVPVEEDGSACFRVPAGVPVYFMALDAQGRAVQRMRSFTHFMPGERQSCIGCHEPRLGTSAPVRGTALDRAPRDLNPPEWGSGGFGYAKVVQPVLDQYCIGCHNRSHPPKGLDLTGDLTDYFNVSYENLAREPQGPEGSPYISWIPTYNGEEQNILKIDPKSWGSPRSRLADIILTGHPDANGMKRFDMDEAGRRRVLAWIDLNVPYYSSSETAHPRRQGCRRMLPDDLEAVLGDVTARRCASCHAQGIPRKEWTRVTNPHLNSFLAAPLARKAGGTGKCGQEVFTSEEDPDYRAILDTFRPIEALLARVPRMDMPGTQPAPDVCRDTQ